MNQVIDISNKPAKLQSVNGLLAITGDDFSTTVPFKEIAVLIASHPQIAMTQLALSDLAEAGGVVLVCGRNYHPTAMMLPLDGNHIQTKKFACQASASLPTKKQAWKTIIQAKIEAQGRILKDVVGDDYGLFQLSNNVKSGDSENVEAVAAARYWKKLFGPEFTRQQENFQNASLNFGYAVLRAITARALCASGLHPSLGLHHKNQYDSFCLADDLMEPFRPLVDWVVFKLPQQNEFDTASKTQLLSGILGKFSCEKEQRTLFDIILSVTQSLARLFVDNEPFKVPSTRHL
jgi:CRISP-associated protein Cas1